MGNQNPLLLSLILKVLSSPDFGSRLFEQDPSLFRDLVSVVSDETCSVSIRAAALRVFQAFIQSQVKYLVCVIHSNASSESTRF